MFLNKVLIVFCFVKLSLCDVDIQSLNGQWTVSGGEIEDLPATVPGGIYSDLMRAGTIQDVFYEKGDTDNFWVGDIDWTYTTIFNVSQELLDHRVVSIIFEGLDTFSTIILNDVEIGKTENMFRRYVFYIKEQLQVGANTLVVKFSSPVRTAKDLALNPENPYFVPPDCAFGNETSICYVNRIRKMQSSFAWDWGPALPSSGIWKDVYLRAFDTGVIDYMIANPLKVPETGEYLILITLYLDMYDISDNSGDFTFNLDLNGTTHLTSFSNVSPKVNEQGERIASFTIPTDNSLIQLWNPNGLGEQILYNFTATYITETETTEKTVRLGFRTIELVQEPVGSGLSFYFKVNGKPIFAKGSNVIPINILPERGQDKDTIRRVLQSARDVNMNMVRVWGGGVYESDYLYDLADEYGILVWQDFMFACALYPADDDFLENVREEVNHQIKRLWSHPSIAIWAGNNENELALAGNWFGVADDFETFKQDYISLYVDTIKYQVSHLTASLGGGIFLTSSPTNGAESEEEGYVARNPGDNRYGDVHYYNYGDDPWTTDTFPILRFSSEFGYQSWPSIDTLLTATDNINFTNDDFWEHRQHHPNGNVELPNLIGFNLQLPPQENDNFVESYVYYSQITQAQAIKTETEHYRSFKGRLAKDGTGYTMGALYWQLNDVWVGPTWSGMDFTGKWKMLHYFAKTFFNNLLVTGRMIGDSLEVYAVLDSFDEPSEGVKCLMQVYKWDSLSPLVSVEFPVNLSTTEAVLVTGIDIATTLATAGCGQNYDESKKNCLFTLLLKDQGNDDLASLNYVFLNKLKDSNIPSANIEISSVIGVGEEGKEFEIEITTDTVALFVWLDSAQIRGTFSENGFLQVVSSKTINFIAEESVSVDDFKDALTITHLMDPQYSM